MEWTQSSQGKSTLSTNNSMIADPGIYFEPSPNSVFVKDPAFFMTLAVLGFLLAAVTTVENAALLLTIFRDTRRLLQTPPSLLITSLCVSDLMVGAIAGNLVALKDVYRYQDRPVPDKLDLVVRLVLALTLLVSSGTIIALSYDRYVVVMHPLKYKSTVTMGRVKLFILVMWTVSLVLCFMTITKIPPKMLELVYAHSHASLPIIMVTVMYIKVFRALGKRKRELIDAGITKEMRSKVVLDRERRMVLTILIVLALFYMTFLPEFIALHVLHLCPSCARSLTFRKLEIIFSRFLFLNSAMNPFVYAWRLPKYRKAVLSCFACPKFRDSKRVQAQTRRSKYNPCVIVSSGGNCKLIQNNKITQTKSRLNKRNNNVGP